MAELDSITSATPLILVGCGNMGAALAKGWLNAGLAADSFWGVDPSDQSNPDHNLPSNQVVESASSLPETLQPRVIVIAVKPQVLKSALSAFEHVDMSNAIVISVAAGASLQTIQDYLPGAQHYVRAMPNLPASIGMGMTGLYAATGSKASVGGLVEALLSANGACLWLAEESQINPLTAVSGSGPAYLFHLVETLAGAAEAEGFSPEEASLLARQTIIGAARLLEGDNTPASVQRARVTSPTGTTAAALDVLMEAGALSKLIREAVRAARRRSEALSKMA